MYLDPKKLPILKLLSDKLGADTTGAIFKYIDSKTERSAEANIKTLAAKADITNICREISKVKADPIKWMFILRGEDRLVQPRRSYFCM